MVYQNMRVWKSTLRNLSIVAAMKDKSMIELIDNLVSQELAALGLGTQAFCVEFFYDDTKGYLIIECRDALEASGAAQCYINTLYDGAITGKVTACDTPLSGGVEFTTPFTEKVFTVYYQQLSHLA